MVPGDGNVGSWPAYDKPITGSIFPRACPMTTTNQRPEGDVRDPHWIADERKDSMTWTREHDALIARVAEGLTVRPWSEMPPHVQNYDYYPLHFFVGDGVHDKLAAYNTDITACLRAAEAWRVQDEYKRRYAAYSPWSPNDHHDVVLWTDWSIPDGASKFSGFGATAAEALAYALYFACGGTA